jgi:shikimate kinase
MGPRVERVVLIGLRRSGKTTVGGILAAATGWDLIDTDDLVHRMTGRTPADWIRRDGLDAFRAAERAAVATLAATRCAVIATGGGVPLAAENREILRRGALVAYLRVDPWILAERARRDPAAASRPPLSAGAPSEESFVLFAERDEIYRSFCDLVVDGASPPEEVATRIRDAFHFEKKNLPS